MSEPNTLLLRESGIARLPDGSEAVNVGPIVVALDFLTEGRGEDRGTDEHGIPLPDLLSLAFDVVQSIILGGRAAEYFRKVKQDFDAQALDGRSSLSLAKQAKAVRPSAPSSALERAASDLRTRLKRLDALQLDDDAFAELKQALQGFQDFGPERWVAATSNLLLALRALDSGKLAKRRPARPRKAAQAKARAKAQPKALATVPKKRTAAKRQR